jgi:hypothetical protein
MRRLQTASGRGGMGVPPVLPQPADGTDPEPVRAAMKLLLRDVDWIHAAPLARAVEDADLPMLCLLRRPLLEGLSSRHGELRALRMIMRLDGQIRTTWPEAPVSRPADLG